MTKKMKRFLALSLALLMAFAVVGCGSTENTTTAAPADNTQTTAAPAADTTTKAPESQGTPQTQAPGQKSSKDTIIIATANETPSLTSVEHNAVAGSYMNKLTFSTLFDTDMDLNVYPSLAESYEVSDDGLDWTIKLKQGVKFHNGAEMKAADVVRSLKLCAESSNTATYGTAANCEVVDDYTVKIHTEVPYSGMLYDLCHHGNDILPADLIDSGHNFNESPIGTGPYKFVKWNLGESLEFEAFEDYFEGEPPIKHMIWKIIPEGSSRTISLEAGEIDVIIEVESNDISRLQDDEGIDVYVGTGTSHNFMLCNTEKAPFNNEEFRIACQQAIDKNACVQVGQNGFAMPCDSLLPIVFPGTTTDGMPTYNPEEAKKHLEASGLSAAECNFTLVCSDDAKVRLGQVIQSNLKENLGIDVQIEQQDLATYLENSRIGEYQAALGGYTSSSLLAYIKGVWHSSNINASNKTRTNDPQVDAWIEQYAASFDADEQAKIATELNTYLNQHCFQIPTYQGQVTRAYVSNLKGFQVSASGNHWWQYCYFE